MLLQRLQGEIRPWPSPLIEFKVLFDPDIFLSEYIIDNFLYIQTRRHGQGLGEMAQ